MAPKVAKVEMNEEELKLKQKLMDDMELKKLKREHRRMKSIGKRDDAIERQGKVITALTKERDNLVSDLNVMQTKKQCVMDAKQTAEITELFARGDSLDVDIAREQRFMDDLKYQTYKESNKLERRRKNIKSQFSASDYRQHMENQRGDRALDALKSKLHAEQVKLGSAIKENAELRKSILLLLKSKTHFNQLFEELVLKLKKGKKIMKDIVEQSQLQLKKRDEVTRKIQALKQRDVADLHKRQEEMQDLEMRYADDKNLTKFRNMVLHVRTKLSEGDKATKKAAAQRLQQEEELQKLRDTWTAVKEVTELEECGDVCELLFRQEAENFSLFNYNNELHDQVEALTEQTAELLKKVDDEQEDRYQWEDQQEREKVKLESLLDNMDNEQNYRNDMCEASFRLFDRLMTKLRALFDLAQCETWPLEDLLGDNEQVTQFNYRLYLELLESRLMQLMSACPRPDTSPQYGFISSFVNPAAQSRLSPLSTIVVDRKEISRPCLECESSNQAKRMIQVTDYI
ncbi:outer dynein arm protein 1-like [Homalodisca vitripennis]|nr:outer dynein arm protein 1-like [Homalodisca vitripennis]